MRILILDLLAERSEFGHGGNIEMIKPFTKIHSEIEVFLITPQYESYSEIEQLELLEINKEKVPMWDDATEFKSQFSEIIEGVLVKFVRILMPIGKVEKISEWIEANEISCMFCSGSRRNVSEPEPWMEHAKKLLMACIILKKPLQTYLEYQL